MINLKKLRKPFDEKVYAILYAGDLFEEQARKLLEEVEKEIKNYILAEHIHLENEKPYLDSLKAQKDIQQIISKLKQ